MNSMEHWGGCQLCAIDLETTGLDPRWNEIIQICILPLDSNIQPRKDVYPFIINMKIECMEKVDPSALKVNRIDLNDLQLKGFDKEKAKDLLREWIVKLNLPVNKAGEPYKIIPLGQNYGAFDEGFLKQWLGLPEYDAIFSRRYVDTMVIASFLNDRAAMHSEKVPYKQVSLKYLAATHHIENENQHNALSDCLTTAQIYRKMIQQGLFA